MSTQPEPLLTVTDIETLPEDGNRYEVIEGELFVSKAPYLAHQDIALNLCFALKSFLNDNPAGHIWMAPGVILSDISGVIPDIAYISNERLSEAASGPRITGAPDMVIEILSPGPENEQRDRVAKRHLYAKYGVREYWVVDPANRSIAVYVRRENFLKQHAVYVEGEELASTVLPGFRCKVESIFG